MQSTERPSVRYLEEWRCAKLGIIVAQHKAVALCCVGGFVFSWSAAVAVVTRKCIEQLVVHHPVVWATRSLGLEACVGYGRREKVLSLSDDVVLWQRVWSTATRDHGWFRVPGSLVEQLLKMVQ